LVDDYYTILYPLFIISLVMPIEHNIPTKYDNIPIIIPIIIIIYINVIYPQNTYTHLDSSPLGGQTLPGTPGPSEPWPRLSELPAE
jgi:hypothetical protein